MVCQVKKKKNYFQSQMTKEKVACLCRFSQYECYIFKMVLNVRNNLLKII